MNAAFRYHGSKYRIYPFIAEYIDKAPVYTESFGGSAAVLLQKPITGIEVYNDLDQDVYNFFHCLRTRSHTLLQAIAATPYSRQLFEEVDEAKRLNQTPTDPIERALHFFILCEQGWGSKKHNGRRSWRKQRTGDNNAPNRSWAWANAPERLLEISDRLRHVFIENRPAIQVVKDYDSPETMHYVDPPYPPSTRTRPDHGYDHEMPDDAQHIELLDALLHLHGKVIVSGMDHPIYNRMLNNWDSIEINSRTASHDYVSTEVLWFSPTCTRQLSLFSISHPCPANDTSAATSAAPNVNTPPPPTPPSKSSVPASEVSA